MNQYTVTLSTKHLEFINKALAFYMNIWLGDLGVIPRSLEGLAVKERTNLTLNLMDVAKMLRSEIRANGYDYRLASEISTIITLLLAGDRNVWLDSVDGTKIVGNDRRNVMR